MSRETKTVVVVPREKAVFRLDRNGQWHIDDERFTNPKIIDYFHSLIRRDENGYYLEQAHRDYTEKVYFPYEDTALFVFHILYGDGPILCLNTGEKIVLEPENLFVRDEVLYVQHGEDTIRFNDRAMLSLAQCMDMENGRYRIEIKGRIFHIPTGGRPTPGLFSD